MWRVTGLIVAAWLVVVLGYGLTGCATAAPPPPPVVTTACLPLKAYSPAEQKAVAAELAALPPGSPLAGFVADYGAMRAADRACMGGK